MKEQFPLLTMAGEMAVYSYSVQCTGTESTLGQYSHNTIGSSIVVVIMMMSDVSVLKVSDSAHVYTLTLLLGIIYCNF